MVGDWFGPMRYASVYPFLKDCDKLYETLHNVGMKYFLVNKRRLPQWEIDTKRHFQVLYENRDGILFKLAPSIAFAGCEKATQPPVLKEIGPVKTEVNQGFNVQPNGESTMWFKAENATITTVAVWGETRLNTLFVNPTELTASVVPKELYSKPGQIQIYLLDTKTGTKSNSIVFTIEE
jgi:hypothetical protein